MERNHRSAMSLVFVQSYVNAKLAIRLPEEIHPAWFSLRISLVSATVFQPIGIRLTDRPRLEARRSAWRSAWNLRGRLADASSTDASRPLHDATTPATPHRAGPIARKRPSPKGTGAKDDSFRGRVAGSTQKSRRLPSGSSALLFSPPFSREKRGKTMRREDSR